MKDLAAAAISAGGGLLGGVLDIATKKWSNKQQLKQQQKLTDQQIAAQKNIGEFNQGLALDMWEKTNYSAQREQLQKAGLNTGLMYGGVGAGGTTNSGQAGGVSGGQASSENTLTNSVLQGMGLAMQQAQIKNVEADTKNKEVDAELKTGVGKEKTIAETQNLNQGIENAKAQKELTEIQTQLQNLELQIKDQTRYEAINTIKETYKQSVAKTDSLLAQSAIDNTTYKDKIKIIQGEAIGITLKNDLTKAGIQLTEEQTKKVSNDILQEWEKIKIQNQQLKLNEKDLKQKAQQIVLNKIQTEFGTGLGAQTERGARILNATAGAISEFIPTKFITTTSKQGDKGGDYWEEYTKQTTTKSK